MIVYIDTDSDWIYLVKETSSGVRHTLDTWYAEIERTRKEQ